jgi:hypothetical protein
MLLPQSSELAVSTLGPRPAGGHGSKDKKKLPPRKCSILQEEYDAMGQSHNAVFDLDGVLTPRAGKRCSTRF